MCDSDHSKFRNKMLYLTIVILAVFVTLTCKYVKYRVVSALDLESNWFDTAAPNENQ